METIRSASPGAEAVHPQAVLPQLLSHRRHGVATEPVL